MATGLFVSGQFYPVWGQFVHASWHLPEPWYARDFPNHNLQGNCAPINHACSKPSGLQHDFWIEIREANSDRKLSYIRAIPLKRQNTCVIWAIIWSSLLMTFTSGNDLQFWLQIRHFKLHRFVLSIFSSGEIVLLILLCCAHDLKRGARISLLFLRMNIVRLQVARRALRSNLHISLLLSTVAVARRMSLDRVAHGQAVTTSKRS